MGFKDRIFIISTLLGVGIYLHTRQLPCDTTKNAIVGYTLDTSSFKDKPETTENHEYIPCMESQDICLNYIKETSGKIPKLLSHRKEQASRKRHPVTGQKFVVPNIFHFVRFGENFTYAFVMRCRCA